MRASEPPARETHISLGKYRGHYENQHTGSECVSFLKKGSEVFGT